MCWGQCFMEFLCAFWSSLGKMLVEEVDAPGLDVTPAELLPCT